jgi:hypothetical protein
MTKIKDIISPREEVLEKNIEPTVQAHKVDSEEERIESSAAKFLRTTYPSNSIKNVIERANQKIKFQDNQGGFLLLGPYGSGKSHALITLYHLFNSPNEADEWTNSWNIDFDIPEDSNSIIISSQTEDPDRLWEPIFKKAGKKELLEDVGRYPTTDTIEELIGEETFAIFFDEIETWWESFEDSKDKSLKEQNKFFLQNLLEVANDKNRQLFTFITLLDKSDELKEILNRTGPVAEDVSTSGDKEKIIRHRLFDNPDENMDEEKAVEIIKQYIEGYSPPIELENEKRFEKEFIDSYPFHPQALEIIGNIYEGSKERQNVRGEMRVLADTIAERSDETDAILLSDISEQPFKMIDRDLVGKCVNDSEKRTDGVSYGPEILRSILFYSLEEETGAATEHDVLLATLKPTEGMTVTDLSMSIESLIGKAHYLHKDDGHYQMKNEYNIAALIQKEKSEVDDDEAEEEIGNIVRKDIFDNQAHIYIQGEENDQIPDHSEVTFVVSLKSLGDEEQTKDELDDFFHGRNYQNTVVFIVPNNGGPAADSEIREKTKRVIAANNLKNRLDEKKSEIDKVLREEKQELKNAIKDKFGYWIKWSSQGSGHEVNAIKRPIDPAIREIREEIRTDPGVIKKNILSEVEGESNGKKVGTILNDFKKMRKYPLIDNENNFYTAIKQIAGEKIFVQGERGKIYRDRAPNEIKDDYALLDPEYAPSPEIEEDEEEQKEDLEDLSDEEEVPTAKPGEEKEITPFSQDARGNSSRAIHNQFEMALNKSKDSVEKLNLDIKFKGKNKEEILEIIENLPETDAEEISARIEGERVEDSK